MYTSMKHPLNHLNDCVLPVAICGQAIKVVKDS